jgi:protein-disulfide isomerase
VLACSSPEAQSGQDAAALRKELDALKAQVTAMQKDVDAIKSLLTRLGANLDSADPPFAKAELHVAGAPAKGSPSATVMLVEVSDYHCPYCKRHYSQVFSKLESEYVNTGKIRYVFADFPVAQLHPDAFRSHEAALCAGDQGKYWEMHAKLFTSPPARDYDALSSLASGVVPDAAALKACLSSQKHAEAVKRSVERMEQQGVPGTPIFFIGKTPSGNDTMKTVKFVYGAKPYAEFKAAIDSVLGQ